MDKKVKQAIGTLSLLDVPKIPRDPAKWRAYVIHLRKNLLGMSQAEFWPLFDIKQSLGSRYEQPEDHGENPKSRRISCEVMSAIAYTLQLAWEGSHDYLSAAGKPTKDGIQALKLLNEYPVTIKELEKLLKILELTKH